MERRRIIEGTWTCTSCDTKGIAGSQKSCPGCGNAREDEEAKFDFGERTASGASKATTVADKEKLELAAAGADWYCAGCGSANKGTATNCRNCGDADPASRLAKKPEVVKAVPEPPKPPPKKSGGKGLFGCLGFLFVGIPVLLCAGIAVFWVTRTHEETGSIAALHWTRDIEIQTFTRETRTGWRGDLSVRPSVMPVNGAGDVSGVDNLRDCQRREKSPAKCENKTKKVECGTEEKCEVKDQGNGFAEEVCKDVTKYCDEPYEECTEAIFDDQCTYDTYKWRSANKVHAEGQDNTPKWPNAPSTGSLDRAVQTEAFELTVSYAGEQSSYAPSGEAEFGKFSVGTPVVVEVNNLGSVKAVRPK